VATTRKKNAIRLGRIRGADTYSDARNGVATSQSNKIGQGVNYFGYPFLIGRLLLYADLGLPEDANISSAFLTFKRDFIEGRTDYALVVQKLENVDKADWYNASNFLIGNFSGNGGSIPVSLAIGEFDITLNEDGFSWLKVGNNTTYLGVRSSREIAGIYPSTDPRIQEMFTFWSYSPPISLTITYTALPEVSTFPAYVEDENYIEVAARVDDAHDDAYCDKIGVCISLSHNPTISDITVEKWGNYGGTEGSFEYWDISYLLLSGVLKYDTTYYFKGYAHNPTGYGYGEERQFTTPPPVIAVTTNAATDIDYEWAMGNGEITSGTNATERGFEIKVDFVGSVYWELEYQFAGFEVEGELESMVWTTNDFGELGFWSVGTMIKTESEEGDFEEGEFSIILGHEKPGFPGEGEGYIWDRLFPCKTYEYRAYAIIDGETYYGEWVEFSTLCEGSGDNQTGTGDDISDANPTEPIIPISPIVPIEPPFTYPPFVYEPDLSDYPDWDWSYPPWDYDLPEIPPWVDPEYPDLPPLPPWYLPELPEWDIPDYPPPTFIGDLYYRKPYTKKDLDELRKKCIIYNKNSVEFALVLRHNMNVLREFLNMMTDYLGTDEFNDFTDLVPPQNLKELYLDPIEPEGFRTIINGFINNTVNNNIAVNRNFKLLTDGLSDYETSEDASFREITSAMKRMDDDNPDVHRMKQIIDNLNQEVTANFSNIMYNLNVVRARLLS